MWIILIAVVPLHVLLFATAWFFYSKFNKYEQIIIKLVDNYTSYTKIDSIACDYVRRITNQYDPSAIIGNESAYHTPMYDKLNHTQQHNTQNGKSIAIISNLNSDLIIDVVADFCNHPAINYALDFLNRSNAYIQAGGT